MKERKEKKVECDEKHYVEILSY